MRYYVQEKLGTSPVAATGRGTKQGFRVALSGGAAGRSRAAQLLEGFRLQLGGDAAVDAEVVAQRRAEPLLLGERRARQAQPLGRTPPGRAAPRIRDEIEDRLLPIPAS